MFEAKGRITILVAVYNTEPYLRECLDSLINQTYNNLQIICIDDASTDGSLAILHEYAKRDNRILVLQNKTNSGQSKTRNHGLEFAIGDYITMVDSDDFLAPDTFEHIINVFDKNPLTDCVLFDFTRFWDNGETEPYANNTDKTVFSGEEAMRLSLDWSIHGVYVIRADIHKKYPYDESTRYTADDITTKQHFFSSREVRLSSGKYFYRQRSESISNAITIRRFDVFIADLALKNHLENLGVNREILSIHERIRWYSLINHWIFFTENKSHFTKEEQNKIIASFDFHASTIDKSLIPTSQKLRTLYIPFLGTKGMKFWAIFYSKIRKIVPSALFRKRIQF